MELMGLRALLVVICATAEVFFISCALGLFRDLRRNQGGGDVRPLRESKE
jgi:hypothetical protein